jgi:hypothetical protein
MAARRASLVLASLVAVACNAILSIESDYHLVSVDGGSMGCVGPDCGGADASSGGDGGRAGGNTGGTGNTGVSGSGGSPGGTANGGDSGSGGSPGGNGPGGDGGSSSGSGGTAGGDSGAGGEAGSGGASPDGSPCGATEKLCPDGVTCAPLEDPSFGCSNPTSCSPCVLDHTLTYECGPLGECAPRTCESGFDDCNGMPNDGCERVIVDDPLNCGACDRVCSGANVLAKACSRDTCTSTCDVGFNNCTAPPGGADDGCEVAADNDSCGSCGESCASNLLCVNGACGCTASLECGGGGGASCTGGFCACGGSQCTPGEKCTGQECVCNGGPPCFPDETCCQAGCRDVAIDPASCGACGRACPPGFVCVAGRCGCDGDGDCNAGSAGTCTGDICACGGTVCAAGERCLGDGTCG